MDYKNQGQNVQGQPFFTAGAGEISPAANNFEPENNLNLTNESTSWSAESVGRSQESSANQISTNPEAILDAPLPSAGNGLGETIDIDLPPTMQVLPEDTTPIIEAALNIKSIRVDGDHISKEALTEAYSAEAKIRKDHNAAEFNARIRGTSKDDPGLLGTIRKNSFGEEVS